MYDDFGYNYGMGCENDVGYVDGGFDFGYLPPKPYKPMKATKRNVEEEISYMLNLPVYDIKFIKLDNLPEDINNWKHSCFQSGVTKMNVGVYPFEDGSTIYVAICSFFPNCKTVEYYVEQSSMGNMNGFY